MIIYSAFRVSLSVIVTIELLSKMSFVVFFSENKKVFQLEGGKKGWKWKRIQKLRRKKRSEKNYKANIKRASRGCNAPILRLF